MLTRVRITFSKTEAMRFTGHLDLHRTWERCFRRARLPLAYTQGFNPHPRLNLAAALPLGFTSRSEIIDVWLEEALSPAEIEHSLQPALPPGLRLIQVQIIDLHAPTLQVELQAADYNITLLETISELDQHLQTLLAAESLPRQRRGKDYDLRPLILALEGLPEDENGCQRLFMRLTARESATGRPEEVAAVLGATPEEIRAQRVGLVFR